MLLHLRLQAPADQGVLRSCWMKCETRGMIKSCRLPQQLMGEEAHIAVEALKIQTDHVLVPVTPGMHK